MTLRRPADQRPQILGTGGDKLGRQQTFGNQPVVAIDVGHDAFEEVGALDEARKKEAASAKQDSHA